ncbi:MAG: hypothetical protein ACK5O2_06485 [Microthrixaceae bacterium]
MSITNSQRHELHQGLIEALGAERAEILMDHLPPVGWADVATKRDLDLLETGLRGELQVQMAELRVHMYRLLLWQTVALIGTLGTLMAIVTALS